MPRGGNRDQAPGADGSRSLAVEIRCEGGIQEMLYGITIVGKPPGLLMSNGNQAIDEDSPLALRIKELAAKRGTNRTVADRQELRRLKCRASLWLSEDGDVILPATAFRAMIEQAARQTKEGPKVRGGLIVTRDAKLRYDYEGLGRTPDEVARNAQMTCGVVVQNKRIEATRARFPEWQATFEVDCDDEQIDAADLKRWIELGGRRIGIGAWRPQKSGPHGTFAVETFGPLGEESS